jgi:hypothetical protein
MTAIDRLYREFLEETDRTARQFADDRTKILDLEREICAELERSHGSAIVGNLHFSLNIVLIDKNRISYFKVVVISERRVSDAGYSFARRKTDGLEVVPVAATQRPSLRRKSVGP